MTFHEWTIFHLEFHHPWNFIKKIHVPEVHPWIFGNCNCCDKFGNWLSLHGLYEILDEKFGKTLFHLQNLMIGNSTIYPMEFMDEIIFKIIFHKWNKFDVIFPFIKIIVVAFGHNTNMKFIHQWGIIHPL